MTTNCDFVTTGKTDGLRHQVTCRQCDRPMFVSQSLGVAITRQCAVINLATFTRRGPTAAIQTAPTPSPPVPKSGAALALQFAQAVRQYVAAGLPRTTAAEQRARDEICAACPADNLRGTGLTRWCAGCGCYLYPKSRMATETCEHWPASEGITTVTVNRAAARECATCNGAPAIARRYPAADQVTPPAPQSHRENGQPATKRLLLKMPHGLGDVVQFSVVLRHLRHHFPDWSIDVATHGFCHSLHAELADDTYSFEDCPPDSSYDIARTLAWLEPDQTYANTPATKSEKCLREVFNIEPAKGLCAYRATVSPEATEAAADFASRLPGPYALIHYQGESSRQNKDLDEQAIKRVCAMLQARGLAPLLIDFSYNSGLIDRPGIYHAQPGLRMFRGNSAAALMALAQQAAFCLGIDSGPGHLFGCTDTPSAIVWRRHHPLHYYGLSPNVTHIVPDDHARYLRGDVDQGVEFFELNYRHQVAHQNYRRTLAGIVEQLLPAVAA